MTPSLMESQELTARMSALVLLSLWAVGGAVAIQQTRMPLLPNVPFLTVWNAPTESCKTKYGVDLDLSLFDIVLNQNQSFMGDNITIFYVDKLGRYPFYTLQGEPVNGGVPQNASLLEHLDLAWADIERYIPHAAFSGLAVVDWESWRPLWVRNWDSKEVYCNASRTLVQQKHPDWPPSKVDSEAQREFQEAGRAFMNRTLQLGREMRPGGWWGFYGMPGCYNYQYKNASLNYTGQCPEVEMRRNEELGWLWNVSSALYPSIYLELELRGRGEAIRRYTQYSVLEAQRCAGQVTPVSPPVLPYARIAYTYSLEFLSQEDLVHTVGEAAALGAAGIVLWGNADYAKSQAVCEEIKGYTDGTLGNYIVNVTTAAVVCSRVRCSSRGRCQRQDSGSKAYLHLDPLSWTVLSKPGPKGMVHSVQGQLNKEEALSMEAKFKCSCYQGWAGRHCKKRL
ncbi:hyaluronidase-1 [Amia ocellicauda]|uniref:hyaluronidase-1 n=1 Tax=Amia ocellicauda TaxID=2972642 RepID=UPI003463E0F6